MKTIYLAGPISTNPEREMVRAIHYAHTLMMLGLEPFVPQLSVVWSKYYHYQYERWLTHDFCWLRKCDALFRIPGFSPGADREEAEARRLGIPIFYSFRKLKKFLKDEKEKKDI